MKNFAAVFIALLSAGCVVPVAGPAIYTPPPVYSRVDIGHYPPPVVYSQPVIVAPPRYAVQQAPVYIRVPPEHHQQWHRHCNHYRACDRPVYFVHEPAAAGSGQLHPGAQRRDERDVRRRHHDHGDARPPAHRPLQPGDPRLR